MVSLFFLHLLLPQYFRYTIHCPIVHISKHCTYYRRATRSLLTSILFWWLAPLFDFLSFSNSLPSAPTIPSHMPKPSIVEANLIFLSSSFSIYYHWFQFCFGSPILILSILISPSGVLHPYLLYDLSSSSSIWSFSKSSSLLHISQ